MEIKQIVGLAILGIVGLLGLVGALKGLSRGIKRQTIRTVSIILSIVVSFLVVKLLYSTVLGAFDGMTMQEVFTMLKESGLEVFDAETEAMLANFDVVIIEYILAIPLALLIGPILFVPVFIIVSAILWIVHAIVCGVIGFRKKNNTGLTRLLGMALGLVQGILVSVVLLVPILGLASTVSGAVDTIRANENKTETDTELIEMYDAELKDIVENPAVTVMSNLGGKLMYNMLATVKVDGNSVKMVDQIDTVLVVYNEMGDLSSLELQNLTPEQQTSLRNVINAVGDSNYFAPLLSALVKGAANIVETDVVATMEEPVKTLMKDVLVIFKTSSGENIKTDLNTFCDFFFLLINEGVLDAAMGPGEGGEEQPDIMEVFFKENANGKTTIDNAITILDSNERTRPIITSLVKISVAYAKESMKDQVGDAAPDLTEEEIDEIYTGVKNGINEVVKIDRNNYASDEEYKGAVSDSIENFVVSNGFMDAADIEANREEMDEIFATVSDHVIENFEGVDEVSDAQVISFILEYYAAYGDGSFQ